MIRRFLPTRAPLLALVLMPLLSACASLPAPDDFLVVRENPRELKAVASDDAMYWVRNFRDEHRGDFKFWSATLESEFVEQRGYSLVNRQELQINGQDVLQLTFEATASGIGYGYLVLMWVESGVFNNRIHVVEYMATNDCFETHVKAVLEAATQSVGR